MLRFEETTAFSQSRGNRRLVMACGAVSLAACLVLQFWDSAPILPYSNRALNAERLMAEAIAAVRNHRQESGRAFDTAVDPNKTGLIGPEYSPLMTSLGQLEAKRTTTNPEIAGAIVRLLEETGVKPGDTVAIGSSGSFPALVIASLAAAKALDANPVVIVSLGASTYGATDTEFDMLDLYSILQKARLAAKGPAAVSLGGEKDVGLDFEPECRDRLIRKIRDRGLPFIQEPELAVNVASRMQVYESNATGRIAAFINSGGGFANLGSSELVLRLDPGINRHITAPPREQRGVLFEMSERNIPVIHLLYIKGLAQALDLPWDPVPLPRRKEAPREATHPSSRGFWLLCAGYFIALLYIASRPYRGAWKR